MVRVSDDARDQWSAFAARHGVTVAGLLEALAQILPADDSLTPWIVGVIEEARAIDVERRRRG